MRILIAVLYWIYAVAFLVSGLGGVFAAHEEMHLLFSLNLERTAADGGATLLNQYRFLRGVEAGFGLLMLLFRVEIFANKKHNAAFLFICFLLPFSRTLSIFIDGWPQFFGMLMVVEYGLFVLFVMHFWRALWRKGSGDAEDAVAAAED